MQQQSPSSEPVYVISVAARLAGLPCWVLRVLDQEEIVVPARTDSNRRLYSDQDIAILARVRHWTEERHVNIAGVKVILELERLNQEQGIEPSAQTSTVARSREEPTVKMDDAESRGGALAVAASNSLAPYNANSK